MATVIMLKEQPLKQTTVHKAAQYMMDEYPDGLPNKAHPFTLFRVMLLSSQTLALLDRKGINWKTMSPANC